MPDKTAFNLRPTPNKERTGQRRLNICYKYCDVGYCPFGSRCKFDHIDQSSFNQYSVIYIQTVFILLNGCHIDC